jgi:hypothetical protein
MKSSSHLKALLTALYFFLKSTILVIISVLLFCPKFVDSESNEPAMKLIEAAFLETARFLAAKVAGYTHNIRKHLTGIWLVLRKILEKVSK